jgi:glucosylceramidase
MITIDRATSTVRYNPDYQPMYLVSRALRPGDVRVDANWASGRNGQLATQAAAFMKPDGTIAALMQNNGPGALTVKLSIGGADHFAAIPAHSDNAILIAP